MRRARPHFEFLDNGGLPIAMAHQGGGDVVGMENRNSMAAMQNASDLGYLYVETDVLVSRDGLVFLAHGAANTKELVDATGTSNILRSVVEELDYADALEKYGGGEHGHMPLLIDVLKTFPHMRFNIDMKTERGAVYLPKVIVAANALHRVLITSFDHRITKRAAKELGGQDMVATSPGVLGGLALLSGGVTAEAYLHYTKAACFQLPLDQEVPGAAGKLTVHTTAEMVALAREHGMQTHLWTLNDPTKIHQGLNMGAGVISDESVRTKEAFEQRGYWTQTA